MTEPQNPVDLPDNLKCHRFFNKDGNEIYPSWGMELDFNFDQQDQCPHHHLVHQNPVEWKGTILAVREISMILIMQQLMEKPEWDRKIYDDAICDKWMAEVLSQAPDFSETMWRYCVAELRDKAKTMHETGIVAAIDVDSQVVYSDSTVPEDLRQELNRAVAPLENVPDKLKDWHPGTRDRVLDLVHPSLFPLVYGRSKVLSEGVVELEDCSSYCGMGTTIEEPAPPDTFWSDQFQWLPCEVAFEGQEDVKILSYINNLHPREHPDLYRIVEKIISKSIPLWDQVLSHTGGGPYVHNGTMRTRDFLRPFKPRIDINHSHYEWPYGETRPCGWTGGGMPETAEAKAALKALVDAHDESKHDHETEEAQGIDPWDMDERWQDSMRILHMPEPKEYQPRKIPKEPPLDLRKEYKDSGLQVIVKLANTYLKPDDPAWEGGNWHVEGLLNEHIVATAIYYFSNTNITPSHLNFQQNGSGDAQLDWHYDQGDYAHIERITGFQDQTGDVIQGLGSVLCRQGRLLAFPNVLQHAVGSFELEDKTQNGERKILTLFLVDPHVRVLSTSKVPPQRKDWWEQELRSKRDGIQKLRSLPNELMEKVFEDVDDFPISMEEAKELREELMEERGPIASAMIENNEGFMFCEH